MPSTAKDSLSESADSGVATPQMSNSQPSDAVGAEVPVTVHASRYSAAAKGGAKLPPVHEETRTVIIFPQGAVVRLSATVTPGELVVLTNNRTGADVICRVTSVKAQPGIQNYVNLEFTQRAVSFWEEPQQASQQTQRSAPPVEKPSVENAAPSETPVPAVTLTPSAAPPMPTPITAGYRAPVAPAPQPPAAKVAPPPAEIKSISPQSLKVSSLAEAPPEKSRAIAKEIPSMAQPVDVEPAPAARQPRAVPSRKPRAESFEMSVPQPANRSRNIALIATAAVALLAVGAAGGAFFLRLNRGTTATQSPAAQPAESAAANESAPVTPDSVATPAVGGKANTLDSSVSVSVPASTRSAESQSLPPQPTPARLTIETPKSEVHIVEPQSQPQPASVARPNVGLGKIAAPNVKTAAKINSVEPPPMLPAEPNALPGGLSDSLMSTVARSPVAPQPAGALVKGGQLQQPKLISSVAAVFPATAKAARVQGDVTVDALIDASGKVASATVVKGNILLQQAALDSVKLWKYQPARLNGQPIAVHVVVDISFRLQ